MNVGWIGLGDMGQVIVPRLLDAGHVVVGWNRTPSKADPLVELGMTVGASPAAVAESSDVVFSPYGVLAMTPTSVPLPRMMLGSPTIPAEATSTAPSPSTSAMAVELGSPVPTNGSTGTEPCTMGHPLIMVPLLSIP